MRLTSLLVTRRLLAIGASLLLLGFLGVAAAQGPGGQGPPSSPPSNGTQPTGNGSQPAGNQTAPTGAPGQPPAGNQSQGDDRRPTDLPAQMPGRMQLTDGAADGRYVNFAFDQGNGTIENYAVGDDVYFATIQAPGPFDAQVQGANVRLTAAGFTILVTDNPTGLLRMQSDNASFALTLADGVNATANQTRIDFNIGNQSAFLTNGTLTDNATIETGQGLFLLFGPSVSTVARDYAPSQARIDEAIADGRVAARIQVFGNATDVLAFQEADVRSVQNPNGSYQVRVDANFTAGRAFVVDFAPGLLNATEIGVLYYSETDGQLVPQGIERADSLDDALVIEPGEGAEYWIVDDTEGAQALVAIPHFSVHVFEVFGIPPEVAPLIVYGLVAAAFVVMMMGVGAFMGRREGV